MVNSSNADVSDHPELLPRKLIRAWSKLQGRGTLEQGRADSPHPVIGGDWLDKGKETALLVPSAAVPQGLEQIVVINPRYKDGSQI